MWSLNDLLSPIEVSLYYQISVRLELKYIFSIIKLLINLYLFLVYFKTFLKLDSEILLI